MPGMTAHRPPECRPCGREAVVHADPEAELPAVATRPDATLGIAASSTRLAVRARDFCVGPMTTLLGPGELLLGGRFPRGGPADGFGLAELGRCPATSPNRGNVRTRAA